MTSATTGTRSRRGTWIAVAAILAVVVGSALLSIGNDGRGGTADPENPAPDGARAVARVLDRHGVEVRVVRGQASFLRSDLDEGTTVVVSNGWSLGASTYRRLARHARAAGGVVLVQPGPRVLAAIGVAEPTYQQGLVSADCSDDRYDDLTVRVPSSAGYPEPGCFGTDRARLLVPAPDDPDTEVLGSTAVLANQTVLDADNAALALRLLGQRDRVVWYVADPADTSATDAVSVRTLLPRWLVPGLWLLVLAGVAALLWRGRRLGPLVAEPMPVVVRAAEATESRGRLYRRTRDRVHAAATLRAATRRRLAVALSLPPERTPGGSEATLAALVLAAARATGRTPDEIGALLADRPVTTDAALTDLGRGLIQLENEVRDR